MKYKLYTIDNQFIKKTNTYAPDFTGIVERNSGTKSWLVNGFLHRLDGPAIELTDATKAWYVDGKLHRLDGPAFEYADGSKEWWIDDAQIKCTNNESFKLHVSLLKLKGLL